MIRSIRIILWITTSLLGAAAVGFTALQREESVNALWLVVAGAKTSLRNARIDLAITITFLLFVGIIVFGTARKCWLLLSKRKPIVLRESEYVRHLEVAEEG